MIPGWDEGLDCHCWGDSGVPAPLVEGEEGVFPAIGLLLCANP